MMIRTTCKKCGATIKLDFGELTKAEALAMVEKMDTTPRECPGMHFEFGGFRQLWSLDDAIHRAYELGEGEASQPVMTDREYVEEQQAQGVEIIDGGQNTVPDLRLPCLHDFPNLKHIGFGNFENHAGVFLRCDSPRGTRFYEWIPNALPAGIPA